MAEALERLCGEEAFPKWMTNLDFEEACATYEDASGRFPTRSIRFKTALARLALGDYLETKAVNMANAIASPKCQDIPDRAALARLYNDSFLAAVWTSTHAQYISLIEDGIQEPPPPSPNMVVCSLSELDLSNLFSRRWCPRMCSKESLPMLNVLLRCTNPGSRGWNSLLEHSLNSSSSVRHVCANSVIVALTAMHPHIHPSLRPGWAERMKIECLASTRLSVSDDIKRVLVEAAPATKEAMRRSLASIVAVLPSTLSAMSAIGHPVGYLTSPPNRLPPRGLEAAMDAFVTAGLSMLEKRTTCLTTEINRAFADHSVAGDVNAPERVRDRLHWNAPWLGTPFFELNQSHCSEGNTPPFAPILAQAKALQASTPRCPSSASPPSSSPPLSAQTSCPSGRTRCPTGCASADSTTCSTRQSTTSTRRSYSARRCQKNRHCRCSVSRSPTAPQG